MSPNRPFFRISNHQSALAAFSLVEVTLAIGIISFSLLAIMGMMPVGLSTFRSAMDQTIESQIVQRFNGQLELTPFSQLATFTSGTFWFNEEGTPITTSTDARYRVSCRLGMTVFPGSTNAPTAINDSIRMVNLDIVRVKGAPTTNTFSIHVPNSGN